jgi:hypothetical protein
MPTGTKLLQRPAEVICKKYTYASQSAYKCLVGKTVFDLWVEVDTNELKKEAFVSTLRLLF